MKTRNILFGTITIVVSTALMLVLAEFVLRVAFPGVAWQEAQNFQVAYVHHDDYLVALKPNVSKKGPKKAQWRSSSAGFRGPELKPAGFRIMVYGDSNVQARFSNLEDTFVYRLARQLENRMEADVEVVNAGVIGSGSDQSLLRFEAQAPVYESDLVVFHIFADNDFGDIIRNRLFELDAEGRLVETSVPRRPDSLISGKTNGFTIDSLMLVRATRKVLEPYPFANRLTREFAVYESGQPKFFSHFGDPYDADVALYPDSRAAKVKRALMTAVIGRAKSFADSRGIAFVVLIQPSSRDMTTYTEPNHVDYTEYEAYKPTNLTDFAEQSARSVGAAFVNLFQPYADNDPDKLFWTDGDTHWNNEGQVLAARVVAEYLTSNGLVSGSK